MQSTYSIAGRRPAEDDVVGLLDLLRCDAVCGVAGLAVGAGLTQFNRSHVIPLQIKHKQAAGHGVYRKERRRVRC